MRTIYKTTTGIEFYEGSEYHQLCKQNGTRYHVVSSNGCADKINMKIKYTPRVFKGTPMRVDVSKGTPYLMIGCIKIEIDDNGEWTIEFNRHNKWEYLRCSKNITTSVPNSGRRGRLGGQNKRVWITGVELKELNEKRAVFSCKSFEFGDESELVRTERVFREFTKK